MDDYAREHLQHIRHVELEVATLLGFYGMFLVWVIPQENFYELAFIVSLVFFLITFKLDLELEKHWDEFNKIAKNDLKLQGFIPKREIYYRFISVHRLVTTLILGLTTYFLAYIIPSWICNNWRQIIGILVAITYWFLDSIRDLMKTQKSKDTWLLVNCS
jgi:hypothetical protein